MSDIIKKAQEIIDSSYQMNYYEILVCNIDVDRIAEIEVNVLDQDRVTIPFQMHNVSDCIDALKDKIKLVESRANEVIEISNNTKIDLQKSDLKVRILENEKKLHNKVILLLSLALGFVAAANLIIGIGAIIPK